MLCQSGRPGGNRVSDIPMIIAMCVHEDISDEGWDYWQAVMNGERDQQKLESLIQKT